MKGIEAVGNALVNEIFVKKVIASKGDSYCLFYRKLPLLRL